MNVSQISPFTVNETGVSTMEGGGTGYMGKAAVNVPVGDNAAILVFRHLLPLSEQDFSLLRKFSENHGIHIWLQPGGPDSAKPFHPAMSELYYDLPEFAVRIAFGPTDFTQVNHAVNRILVSRAVRLLDPQPGERVGDLF